MLIMYNLVKNFVRSRSISNLLNVKQRRDILFCTKFCHTKPKVLVTRAGLPGEGINQLKEECDVDIYEKDDSMPKGEILRRIPGAQGLLCCLTDNVDKEVIKAAGDKLKVISTMSAGYDHIDLKECKERNIVVSHTPHVNANSVAEWTVMLMICAGRRFPEAIAAVKNGEWTNRWQPSFLIGKGLEDSVVGIVGMGRIGQCIIKRVFPFGVKRILYYDIRHPIEPAEEMGAIYADFHDLVKESDFIVSMCNLTEETRNLFNKNVFKLMKPSAVFINTSRGEVVHQDDLYYALKHKIRAAAIDVTVPEPLPSYHELNTLSNLIITPHIASSERDVIIKMANLAAKNVLLGLKGEHLETAVPTSE